MIELKSIKRWLLLIFFFSNLIYSATYYVDASNGSDNNSGTSESSPWRTLLKVNSINFLPGDQILFKRGNRWQESSGLFIKNSGTATNRILFGAYGDGNRPVISAQKPLPGWKNTANWSMVTTNVWRMSFSDAVNITRIWLDGKEYRESKNSDNGTNYGTFSAGSINSTDRWNSDGSNIYVFATSNPATYYSQVEVPCTLSSDRACKITRADYVTLQDLDFQGGSECIQVEGSDYLIIQDCNIGKYTRNTAVFVYNSSNLRSDKGIIRRNTVDYYNTAGKPYWHNNVSSGIYLASGSSYWKIYDNFVKDWSLGGIIILAKTDSSTYNEIYNNEITAPNLSYGRPIQVSGYTKSGVNYKASNNKLYNNYIHDCNVRMQFTGSYNEFMYNIVANITDNTNDFPLDHAGGNDGQAFNLFNSNDNQSYYNKIYNNTFYNISRAGIWIDSYQSQYNYILNNLLIDCGENEGSNKYGLKFTTGAANNYYRNNLFWYSGKTTTDLLILTNRDAGNIPPDFYFLARTVAGLNKESGQNGNAMSGNLQSTSLQSGLINSDFTLPGGSQAINGGLSLNWMRATDYNGNSLNGTRDIGAIEYSNNVIPVNTPPVINSSPVLTAEVNKTYTYDVNASGTPTASYKLITYPSGMSINSSTGLIQWVPQTSGSFDITVEANNGVLPAAIQSFTILVSQNTISNNIQAVGYWKLDEISGSTFMDQTGNNDATAVSAPTPIAGKVDGAQKFDGSSKLDVPASSSFDILANGNFSIEYWYNGANAPSTVKAAVSRYLPEKGAFWWLGLNAVDGKARFYMSGGGASTALNGQVITDGNWHYVVTTMNGSTGSIKLYIDGTLQASTTKFFTMDFSSTTANLNIGWSKFQEAYTISGALDEIAFYKTELSAQDISEHYNNSVAGKSYFNNTNISSVMVNTKFFLQGPYSGGAMSTTLNNNNRIPLTQPYSSAPWNYTGSEKVASIPANVVDWVLLEIRSDASTVIKRRAAFIKSDGSVVDLNGVDKVAFPGVASGSYYIVANHRNHLGIMSSVKADLSAASALYDFTSSAGMAYGSNAMINMGDGRYALIAGDGDANGLINILDYGMVSKNYSQSGYYPGDIDMNNIVDVNDYNKCGIKLFQFTKIPQ